MLHARTDYQRIQDPAGLIPADEPVFLIRAQDAVGADVVEYWADRAVEEGASPEIVQAAREHAQRMREWPTKKTPDMPQQ